MIPADVRIVVGTEQFAEWTRYEIEGSVDSDADAFSFSVANPDGRISGKLALYDRVKVLVDGTVQMTGYIDELHYRVEEGSTIEAIGRDAFGQMIDVSADVGSLGRIDLKRLAETLGDPYVTEWQLQNEVNRQKLIRARKDYHKRLQMQSAVAATLPGDSWNASGEQLKQLLDVQKAKTIASANLNRAQAAVQPRVKVEPGESKLEVLLRAVEKANLHVWSAADGTGVIARPNYDQAPLYTFYLYPRSDARCRLNNVETLEVAESGRDRYASYTAKSTTINSADSYGEDTRNQTTLDDANVALARHYIHAGGAATRAQLRAELSKEVQRREFDALELRITAAGHHQGGVYYQVDTLASVEDAVTGHAGLYYVYRRRFVGTENGEQRTELTLRKPRIWLA